MVFISKLSIKPNFLSMNTTTRGKTKVIIAIIATTGHLNVQSYTPKEYGSNLIQSNKPILIINIGCVMIEIICAGIFFNGMSVIFYILKIIIKPDTESGRNILALVIILTFFVFVAIQTPVCCIYVCQRTCCTRFKTH